MKSYPVIEARVVTRRLSQARSLAQSMRRWRALCDDIVQEGRRHHTRSRLYLHFICYESMRRKYADLGSQAIALGIAQASQELKGATRAQHYLLDARSASLVSGSAGVQISLRLGRRRVRLPIDPHLSHPALLDHPKRCKPRAIHARLIDDRLIIEGTWSVSGEEMTA